MTKKPLLFKGFNITPMEERGFVNHGSVLGTSRTQVCGDKYVVIN